MCRRRDNGPGVGDGEAAEERKEINHYSTCFSFNCETFLSFASLALESLYLFATQQSTLKDDDEVEFFSAYFTEDADFNC